MRDISAPTLAALDGDRVIGARMTVRDILPRFTEDPIDDTVTITIPVKYDSDWTGSGILRVVNWNDVLWYQYDAIWGNLSGWSTTGKALEPGSGVAVFQNRIFYQDSAGQFQYVDYPSFTPTSWSPAYMDTDLPANFAPVSTTAIYYMQEDSRFDGDSWIYHSGIYLYDGSTNYKWPGQHYDIASTIEYFDACRMQNPLSEDIDFIFFAEQEGKKAIYIKREAQNWSKQEAVVPLDVIDDTSQFKLGGVNKINNQMWVTGRMVRAAGNDLQVYMRGFEDGDWNPHFTLGREMFICEHSGTVDQAGGKMFQQGGNLWFLGMDHRFYADETLLVGVDNASFKTVIDGIEAFSMGCNHNSPTQLSISLDPADDHALLDHGNLIDLEIAYGGNYSSIGQFIIEQVRRPRHGQGNELTLSCVDEVGYRLNAWANDADYDYWGPYKQDTYAKNMAHLLRDQGQWEDQDTNGLKNVEMVPYTPDCLGTLFSIERPARNGMVQAKFDFTEDPTDLMRLQIGVFMNFYNETRAEAEARGGSLGSSSYGVEMMAALYGLEEAAGPSKGIAFYKAVPNTSGYDQWQTTSLARMDSQVVDLGDVVLWIGMVYTDGEVKIYTRTDGLSQWTQRVITTYDSNLHHAFYEGKKRGRAGVWLGNPCDYFHIEPFKRGSLYIPFLSCSATVPASDTIVIDNEILSYSAKGPETAGAWVNGMGNLEFAPDRSTFPDKADHDNPYTGPWDGYEVYVNHKDSSTDHNYYDGMALCVVDGPGKGNVWKITDYDYVAPDQWVDTGGPYTYPDNWMNYVGNLSYGYWSDEDYKRFFVEEDPGKVLGEGSVFSVSYRLDIDTRALQDTIETSHDDTVGMFWRSDVPKVEEFRSVSGEREMSFDWIAKDIARRAGIWNVESAELDGGADFITHAGWDISLDHTNFWRKEQDAIIETYITSINTEFGVATLPETLGAGSKGWICTVNSNSVMLYEYDSGGRTLKEKLFHNRYITDAKVTWVIHGNFMTVYIGDAFIWSFAIDEQQAGTCLVSNNATFFTWRWSALDIRVDNFICDMGQSAWGSINRLIGEKNIHFQHDEGTLYFLTDRVLINSGDPYDLAVLGTDTDDESSLATRLRLEGVDVYEHLDVPNMKQYGNLFRMAHSEEINSLGELEKEAKRILDEASRSIDITQLAGAADPRVEPDDEVNVLFTGSDRADTRDMVVDGVQFEMSISKEGAIFDMDIEGRDA